MNIAHLYLQLLTEIELQFLKIIQTYLPYLFMVKKTILLEKKIVT